MWFVCKCLLLFVLKGFFVTTKCEEETTTLDYNFVDEDRSIKSECLESKVVLLRNLTFGLRSSQSVLQQDFLTWGEEEFDPLSCMSEFVVFYRESGDSSLNVLCTSYDIKKLKNSKFGCQTNFTDENCNKTIILTMEAWTIGGSLLQPTSVPLVIDCDTDQNDLEQTTESPSEEEEVTAQVILSSDEIGPEVVVSCLWSDWTSWSSCSHSCGSSPGLRSRKRSQRGSQKCQRQEAETKECHLNLCPSDCQWGYWEEWTSCSQTCGTGRKIRERQIHAKEAYGGQKCLDKDNKEVEKCVVNICPVDGEWNQWSHWSYCSATCGQGQRRRNRFCNQPPPEHEGKLCDGDDLETSNCTLKECQPIDGGWSQWSRWSACNQQCGRGNITRLRFCSNPSPASGGQPCDGESHQTRSCYLNKCTPQAEQETSTVQTTTKGLFSDSGIHFRPTQRSKLVSSTVRNTKLPVVNEDCTEAPFILGFEGPFKSDDIGIGDTEPNVYYTCNGGNVLDTITNRRMVRFPCANVTQFRSPKRWPKCKRPTHCVGPAKKPDTSDLYLPIPRRDSPVNEMIRYFCRETNASIFASCFPDGNYRYPTTFPNCSKETPEIRTVCSEGSFDAGVIEAGTTQGDYGWIESSNYPSFNTESFDCQWKIKIPPGLSIQIGFEEFVLEEPDSDSVESPKRPRLDDHEDEVKKTDNHPASIQILDPESGSSLFRAPLASVKGATYKSRFESDISFKINSGSDDRNRVRFRINYVLVELP